MDHNNYKDAQHAYEQMYLNLHIFWLTTILLFLSLFSNFKKTFYDCQHELLYFIINALGDPKNVQAVTKQKN